MFSLNVNGQKYEVDADPDTPLLWALRDYIGLTGTKFGCGIAYCGACTVKVGNNLIRSCSFPVSAVGEQPVETIEGLGNNAVQQAWQELEVPQCGYCQSGMMMASTHLLQNNDSPTDADIDQAMTNICRCGTYNRVRAAIHLAAQSNKTAKLTMPEEQDASELFYEAQGLSGVQS